MKNDTQIRQGCASEKGIKRAEDMEAYIEHQRYMNNLIICSHDRLL